MVEDRDTILELTGKFQELQNETNCMDDSRDFQDAESIRSGNSHVTSRPVSFPPHPIPGGTDNPTLPVHQCFFPPHPDLGGMLSRSQGMPSRKKRAAKYLWHTWYIGNVFGKSRFVIISTLSSRIASMEFIDRGAASYVYSGEK